MKLILSIQILGEKNRPLTGGFLLMNFSRKRNSTTAKITPPAELNRYTNIDPEKSFLKRLMHKWWSIL